MRAVHLIIHGRVQGVALRDFAVKFARELGITGYVGNRKDGTVEACAEGDEASLREFLRRIKEEHPYARIDRVEESWGEATGRYHDFQKRRNL